MKKKNLPLVALLTVVVAAAIGFLVYTNSSHASLPTPGEPLVFNGTVLTVAEENVYVEATAQKFTKISVSVFDDTEIVFSDGTAATLDDIKKGAAVTVTNFGLIAESYPAQTSAQKIVIQK